MVFSTIRFHICLYFSLPKLDNEIYNFHSEVVYIHKKYKQLKTQIEFYFSITIHGYDALKISILIKNKKVKKIN